MRTCYFSLTVNNSNVEFLATLWVREGLLLVPRHLYGFLEVLAPMFASSPLRLLGILNDVQPLHVLSRNFSSR